MKSKGNGRDDQMIADKTPIEMQPEQPAPLLDLNMAEQLINAAKERRAKACTEQVNAILRKHNCALVCRPVDQSGNTIKFQAAVVPLEVKTKPVDPEKM